MKKVALSALALSMAFAGQVMAQTCASPLAIGSDQTYAPGPNQNPALAQDLCTASNSLPNYGGIASSQRDIVYSFVAQGANATVTVEHTGAAFGATIVLMPDPCASSTDIIGAGDFANPMTVNGLTDGATYYIVATADPGGPVDACGTFGINVTGPLPVELQSFSVD